MNGNTAAEGASLSRRGFLRLGAAGAAVTAADWRLWAADEDLPAYYGEHLAKVAARLRALSKTCDDAFFFITDLHIPANKYQHFFRYFSDVAEVSADGVLAAKKPGEAVVLAMRPDGGKSVFPVSVG